MSSYICFMSRKHSFEIIFKINYLLFLMLKNRKTLFHPNSVSFNKIRLKIVMLLKNGN